MAGSERASAGKAAMKCGVELDRAVAGAFAHLCGAMVLFLSWLCTAVRGLLASSATFAGAPLRGGGCVGERKGNGSVGLWLLVAWSRDFRDLTIEVE